MSRTLEKPFHIALRSQARLEWIPQLLGLLGSFEFLPVPF